jgi:prepilin-type N-terminal cleavage/methylation domain-containing protein
MKRTRGFTLIELVIVVCVVGLLFGIALDRLLRYRELGERAALQQNVAAINTALALRFAAYVVMGTPQRIADEVGRNPVHLLARAPENYLGELTAADPQTLTRPSWYFDTSAGDLVYLPTRRRYFGSSSEAPDSIRFRVGLTAAEGGTGELRVLPQPFVAANPPFKWEIE